MPHLNELSKKHTGKVIVTAVNVWEEREPKDDSYIAKVEKYVKDFGDGMVYNVVADDPTGSIAKAWMEASGSGGIPQTFVVDGTGTIIWMGHPMALDKPLEEMLAGTYDVKKEIERKAAADKAAAERRALMKPYADAMAAKDYAKAVAELDKVVEQKPEMARQLGFTKYNVLYNFDEAGAYAWGRTLAEGMFKEDSNALNTIAWMIIDPAAKDKRKNPDLKLAMEVAERANALSGDKDPMIMDTYALALYLGGKKTEAIALQERAVKIGEATEGFDATMLKDLKDRLAEWKAAG